MFEVMILVKRNLKNYLRDKLTVFFSLLSTLILVVLFFIFIKKTYVTKLGDSVEDSLTNALVIAQLIGGAVTLNLFSMILGCMGGVVEDYATQKITGLLVSRLPKIKLVLSYIISSWIISMLVTLILSLGLILYMSISTGVWFSVGAIVLFILILIAFSILAVAMMFCIVAILKSQSAYSAVVGLTGTFFGFICGIFMPYSIIGEGAAAIGSILPPAQMSVAIKSLLLNDLLKSHDVPDSVSTEVLSQFGGKEIGLLGMDIPIVIVVLIQAVILGGLLVLATKHLKKRFSI
jgi:multidrug/hemolysin transport system permease protein